MKTPLNIMLHVFYTCLNSLYVFVSSKHVTWYKVSKVENPVINEYTILYHDFICAFLYIRQMQSCL